jgi:hypothetical protein
VTEAMQAGAAGGAAMMMVIKRCSCQQQNSQPKQTKRSRYDTAFFCAGRQFEGAVQGMTIY